MCTAIVFFLPLSVYFFYQVIQRHVASPLDWILGIALGIVLNYIGIIKLIDWLKDESTPYVFPTRCLVPGKRKTSVEA